MGGNELENSSCALKGWTISLWFQCFNLGEVLRTVIYDLLGISSTTDTVTRGQVKYDA